MEYLKNGLNLVEDSLIFEVMKRVFPLLLIVLMCSLAVPLIAQCPMCKMAAESNLQNGGSAGTGLNRGILYILMIPYILIGSLAVIWYKNRVKNSDSNADDLDAQLKREISTIH